MTEELNPSVARLDAARGNYDSCAKKILDYLVESSITLEELLPMVQDLRESVSALGSSEEYYLECVKRLHDGLFHANFGCDQ